MLFHYARVSTTDQNLDRQIQVRMLIENNYKRCYQIFVRETKLHVYLWID